MRRRETAPDRRVPGLRGAGCVGALLVCAAVLTAQPQAATLLVAADGPSAFDSRLFRVDTVSGRVETLYAQQMGRFVDLVMDRDNVGFTSVWQGPQSSGLHFMKANGGIATIRRSVVTTGPKLACVNLTPEDIWAVGTQPELGRSRLRGLMPGLGRFVDVDNFPGASIDRLLIERQQARYVFAMNGTGGALLSYNVFNRSTQTTIVRNLGTITDIDQDPYSGAYLVSTRTKAQPLTMVLPIGNQSITASFAFPATVFPRGVDVEGMALGNRGSGQHAPLWVAAGGRVWTLRWNSDQLRVEFPSPLQSIPLPAQGGVNAMIVEGDRDFLLTTAQVAPNQWVLRLRLGPALANKPYVIGASLAPTPGIKIGDGRMINLRPDRFFWLVNQGQMGAIFKDFVGKTGGEGEVTGSVTATQSWRRALTGLTVYFAGVVLDPAVPGSVRTISNTVGFQLQ